MVGGWRRKACQGWEHGVMHTYLLLLLLWGGQLPSIAWPHGRGIRQCYGGGKQGGLDPLGIKLQREKLFQTAICLTQCPKTPGFLTLPIQQRCLPVSPISPSQEQSKGPGPPLPCRALSPM